MGPDDFGDPFNLPNHPVAGVTWDEAMAFCRWFESQIANREWRVWRDGQVEVRRLEARNITVCLPSEAEWEKAARGVDGRRYPSGDDPDPDWVIYDKTRICTTTAVGCFPGGASPYGVEDLSGNVWGWTRDLYGDFLPYDPEDGREDQGFEWNVARVLRGGGFLWPGGLVPCVHRVIRYPENRDEDYGFRVVAAPVHL